MAHNLNLISVNGSCCWSPVLNVPEVHSRTIPLFSQPMEVTMAKKEKKKKVEKKKEKQKKGKGKKKK